MTRCVGGKEKMDSRLRGNGYRGGGNDGSEDENDGSGGGNDEGGCGNKRLKVCSGAGFFVAEPPQNDIWMEKVDTWVKIG